MGTLSGAGKAGLSGAGSEARTATFDEAVSRATAERTGFIGQAPEERWVAKGGTTLASRQTQTEFDWELTIEETDFRNAATRSYHYGKPDHGFQMGFLDEKDYLAGARSLLKRGFRGEDELWIRPNGDVIAVEHQTGRLAIFSPEEGIIRTFYEPTQGYRYIAGEVLREEWEPVAGWG